MTTPIDNPKLDTIRKLLAKAERAATPQEAEAFSAKAQELMLRYAIDEAMLGTKQQSTDKIGFRQIVVRFYPRPKVSLLSGIAKAFGAKAIYMPGKGNSSSLTVEIFGWESDLALIQTLYASLEIQAMRELEFRWNALQVPVPGGRKPYTNSFLLGFASAVAGRLADQRSSAVQQAEDTHPGTGLVLIDRNKAVSREFAARNPRVGTSKTGASSAAGYNSGQAAGQAADLGGGSRLGARGFAALGR